MNDPRQLLPLLFTTFGLASGCGSGLTDEQQQRIDDVCGDPACLTSTNTHCAVLAGWEDDNSHRCFDQLLDSAICGAKWECTGLSVNEADFECGPEERALENCEDGFTCPGDPSCSN